MSDDDGLMLNFAPAAAASSSRRPQKQGKEQKKAAPTPATKRAPIVTAPKKASSSERPQTTRTPSQSYAPPPAPSARQPVQKAQPNLADKQTPRVSAQPSPSAAKGAPSKGGKPRGTAVISSLFSGNDALQEVTDADALVQRDPTNAPSKASDFASLRLDPLLVSHLASEKMKIKRPTGIQRTALPFLLSSNTLQRDALLHAQTGSGKTLCYLLPILQSLLPYCEASWIDRSCLGTLAIILAPTRELARQIYEVAEQICSLHLGNSRAQNSKGAEDEEEEGDDQPSGPRRTRWIIPGLLSGGSTKNHEKSRLRKGIPLIVATPGRLLDHLRNTASLDVGRLQWLVLDEADRLLQLGFEETLNDILKAIDGRRRAACDVQRQRMRDELGNQYNGETIDDATVVDSFGEHWWKFERRTILCSATLDEGVQVLAGKSLRDPKVIRTEGVEKEDAESDVGQGDEPQKAVDATPQRVAAPAQLVQNYVMVPTKQRFIILVALIRRAIAAAPASKIMVFLSCTDSVDFHLAALQGVKMARDAEYDADATKDARAVEFHSQLFPNTSLFRLHGSLSAHNRQASLKAFAQSKQSAVLFCTSVASRGLDLHVSHVIQVDPPTDKGADEYIHRVGRTARAGEQGESWLLVLPSEEGCVAHYERAMQERGSSAAAKDGAAIHRVESTTVLRDGFGGSDLVQTQTRATDAQMALERWTSADEQHAMPARRAFLSHLRAYATHSPSERSIFSVGALQLGHLAKAFALREAPAEIRAKVKQQQQHEKTASAVTASNANKRKRAGEKALPDVDGDGGVHSDDEADLFDAERKPSQKLQFQRNEETEARMYAKVRQLGMLHKRAGVLAAHGADEFQIA